VRFVVTVIGLDTEVKGQWGYPIFLKHWMSKLVPRQVLISKCSFGASGALPAAELLISGDLGVIREFRSETCPWLFLEESKNHSRRWCDMKTCGNRVKARRYYRRRGFR